ncbi:MAG: hypothetical protein FWF46_09335 [Oscillospiraceae bacterium]|nr:hypothetical protein [Oscillospiraceae bacterium]
MIFIVLSVIITIILSIPIYFILKWVLKKIKVGNNKNRKYFTLFSSVILSLLLFFVVCKLTIWSFIFVILNSDKKDKPFNVNEWQTETEYRYTMSNDIIDKNLIIGKTKDEVIALLGNDFIEYEKNHIGYSLGYVVDGLLGSNHAILDIYIENDTIYKVSERDE